MATTLAALLIPIIAAAQQQPGADAAGPPRDPAAGVEIRLCDRRVHQQGLRLRRPVHAGRRVPHLPRRQGAEHVRRARAPGGGRARRHGRLQGRAVGRHRPRDGEPRDRAVAGRRHREGLSHRDRARRRAGQGRSAGPLRRRIRAHPQGWRFKSRTHVLAAGQQEVSRGSRPDTLASGPALRSLSVASTRRRCASLAVDVAAGWPSSRSSIR